MHFSECSVMYYLHSPNTGEFVKLKNDPPADVITKANTMLASEEVTRRTNEHIVTGALEYTLMISEYDEKRHKEKINVNKAVPGRTGTPGFLIGEDNEPYHVARTCKFEEKGSF